MKRAVVTSLNVSMECMGRKMTSLLDSGNMVSLVQQSYFDRNIEPRLGLAKGL